MLYAIIAKGWVSGVFEHELAARDYLQDIPEAMRTQHVLRRLDDLHYPVYLVEDSAGFRFMREEAALDEIRTRTPTADDDDCRMTLYCIDHDYRPRVAGEDEMGRLAHQHIDNELLTRVRREGRASLWLMVAGDREKPSVHLR